MAEAGFDPDRPMDPPAWRPDVTLVPWGTNEPRGATRAAGLFDADGKYLPDGECWRTRHNPITVEPERDPGEPVERLEGRWLFGGLFYGHFGHLLCESTARLWALDQLDGVDGVLFHPKLRLTHEHRMIRDHLSIFRTLGLGDLTIRAPQRPVTVEWMAVPEQGFGIGEMAAGRPDYRDFMRDRLSRAARPDGPEALYVSRSSLPSKRGSVLLETRLESLFADAGYAVFHPQQHPLDVQIAHYRAARRIVSLDGSALHLAAMVAEPGTEVAILNRGPSQNIADYDRQFRRFASIQPLCVDAVLAFWFETGRRVVKRETHALLDLEAVGMSLAAAGFLPKGTVWANPEDSALAAAVAALEERTGRPLSRYERSPEDA